MGLGRNVWRQGRVSRDASKPENRGVVGQNVVASGDDEPVVVPTADFRGTRAGGHRTRQRQRRERLAPPKKGTSRFTRFLQ